MSRTATLIGWRIRFYERGREDAQRGATMVCRDGDSLARRMYARGYLDASSRRSRERRLPQLELSLTEGR